MTIKKPNILTIAGSDSGGGAGIQADIKAISANGGYACSVITALTAQNTMKVSEIMPISGSFIHSQLDAIFTDIDISAIKIGMLHDSDIIKKISSYLKNHKSTPIILDPVMVSTTGSVLLNDEAISSLEKELFPISTLITPNIYEALVLLGTKEESLDDNITADLIHEMAVNIYKKYQINVLLKGGHLANLNNDISTDILVTKGGLKEFNAKRISTKNTHGTGCSLSSAIATHVGHGSTLGVAIQKSKSYIQTAIEHADGLNVGKGSGPINHFFNI